MCELWTGRKKLNQCGKTPDTNYPRSHKGHFLPTDGNQLATWLQENTWAAVWSQDANEAEGKVGADLPTVLGEEKLMEETAEVQFLENGK